MSKIIRNLDIPARTEIKQQLIDGEELSVEEVAEQYYTGSTEEARIRAQGLLCSLRSELERRENRLLVCRNGYYRLISADEKEEYLMELQIRKERAKTVVEGYAQSVRLTAKYVPEQKELIDINVQDFRNHMMKISDNLLPG